MKFRMWFRSAITGRFVKPKEAQDSPETIVREKTTTITWKHLICDVCGKEVGQIVTTAPFQVISAICSACVWTDPLLKTAAEIWDGKIWYPLGVK